MSGAGPTERPGPPPPASYPVGEQRARHMAAGLTWFSGWLCDQLADGLAVAESDPLAHLGEAAARLTDAQLPGPARALRDWIDRVGLEADWAEGYLTELGYWHLLTELGRDLERRPPEFRAGVLSALGVNARRGELEAREPVSEDVWTCLGIETGERERVFFRRIYWAGSRAEHRATQLDFNYGAPVAPSQVEVGTAGRFGVRTYPEGLPGRILAPSGYTPERASRPAHHHRTWSEQRSAGARLLAHRPWLRELPLAVGPVRLQLLDGLLFLLDESGAGPALPAGRDDVTAWRLLGMAGGGEAVVFGNLRDRRVELLSVWVAGAMRDLGE